MSDNEDDIKLQAPKKGVTDFGKFLQKQWNLVERPYSQEINDINTMLCDLGKGSESVIKENLGTLGEVMYVEKIRDKLVANKLVNKNIPVGFENLPNVENNVNRENNSNEMINEISESVCAKLVEKGIKHNANNVSNTVTRIAANYGINKVTIKNTIKKKQSKQGKNKNIKKSKTAEQIIMDNTLATVQKLIDELIIKMNMRNPSLTFGFRSTYAEIRLITLLFYINNYLKNISEPLAYDLIIGITMILNGLREKQKKYKLVKQDLIYHEVLSSFNLADLKDPHYLMNKNKYSDYSMFNNISNTLCSDLNEMNEILKKNSKFKFEKVFSSYPKLCISTSFDIVFQSINIKPYASQEELITKLRTLIYGLYMYRTSVGSGKTSNSLAVASLVQTIRNSHSNKVGNPLQTLQLLFACSVEPVRIEAGRLMYNSKIPFAIAVTEIDKEEGTTKVKIINSWMCRKDPCPVVIIADLEATYHLLKEKKNVELSRNPRNYILYLDEPTVGADQDNHPITEIVMKILTCMPKTTILSSATLPEIKELPQVANLYSQMYPEYAANIFDIYSKDSMIGCQIITPDGNNFVPHFGCKTKEELLTIIKFLKEEPFIDRLLCAPIIYDLTVAMKAEHITDVIDLELYFTTCQNLCQTEIQKVGIKLLELLATCSNDIIEKICSRNVNLSTLHVNYNDEVIDNKSEHDSDNDFWDNSDSESDSDNDKDNSKENKTTKFDISNLLTTEASNYIGPCLVATNKPYELAYNISKNLLTKCPSAATLIHEYCDAIKKYDDEINKLNRVKNEDDKGKLLNNLEQNKPRIRFPNYLRVNTVMHLKKLLLNYLRKEH